MRELVARLGSDWVETSHGVLLHRPTSLEFAVVAGGTMQMGVRPSDLEEIGRHIEYDRVEYSIEVDSRSALPVHQVEVRPFLCARRPLPEGSMPRAEAIERTSTLGFRLPSEAELEWILRDGDRYALTLGATPIPGRPGQFTFGPSRWGIERLLVAQWVADDWHPTYEGAPSTSTPWRDGDPAGVCRCTFALPAMVCEEDIAVLLAGLRARGDARMPAVARPVLDLP